MSEPKAPKKATKPQKTEPSTNVPDITATLYTSGQVSFLNRTSRFLVNVASGKYMDRAFKNGYNQAEHHQGWGFWALAAGMNRPLSHRLAEQQAAADVSHLSGETRRLLQNIDAFENLWFPRARMILQRHIPAESRDTFTAAFFADMPQQPLGPTVVGSVRKYLSRFADLAKSAAPGAKKAYETLVERGLTPNAVTAVELLLTEAEQGPAAKLPKLTVDPQEIAAAQAEQLAGFESLRLWFNDIATQLRAAFNVRDQVNLGLTRLRRGAPVNEDEGAVIDEDTEEGAGDGEDGAGEDGIGEEAAAPAPNPAKPKGK